MNIIVYMQNNMFVIKKVRDFYLFLHILHLITFYRGVNSQKF